MDSKYLELIQESIELFSKCKDEDLFSSKMTHLYYNGVVTREKAQLFREQFLQCNQTKNVNGIKEVPKPIVIHLQSNGGDVLGIDIFESILFQARVPFCVVIEDMCASAATFLALYAPYRVMIDFSQYLIHDSSGITFGKTSNMVASQKYALDAFIRYRNLLKSRTKCTDKEIDEYIQRDKMISANDCLKKGIVDRVLSFPSIKPYQIGTKKSGNLSLPIETFLKKTNFNTISVDLWNMSQNPNESVSTLPIVPFTSINSIESFIFALDGNILQKMNINQIKPLILQILPLYSYTQLIIKPIVHVGLLYRIALIQHLGVPVVAYCEGLQNLSSLFLSLMCPNRIALKPYYITTEFTYRGVEWAFKFVDQIYNTKVMMSELTRFGKRFSKLPEKFYLKLDKELFNITPAEQLKYGLIHHQLDTHPTHISNQNIKKYLKMNQLSLNEKKKSGKKRSKNQPLQ